MARQHKTITSTVTSTRTVCTEVACCRCRRLAPRPQDSCAVVGLSNLVWAVDQFDCTRVTIALETGERYPEGGRGETLAVDMCPECFRTWLIPALRAAGARDDDFITTQYDD